jgi:choline dehydrogenase-like flavoprotein
MYNERDSVDFVIVGSGAAGGVLAKELATAGFDVVVFEAGPWQQPNQFTHDELAEGRENAMLNLAFEPIQTIRASEADKARPNTGRALA